MWSTSSWYWVLSKHQWIQAKDGTSRCWLRMQGGWFCKAFSRLKLRCHCVLEGAYRPYLHHSGHCPDVAVSSAAIYLLSHVCIAFLTLEKWFSSISIKGEKVIVFQKIQKQRWKVTALHFRREPKSLFLCGSEEPSNVLTRQCAWWLGAALWRQTPGGTSPA